MGTGGNVAVMLQRVRGFRQTAAKLQEKRQNNKQILHYYGNILPFTQN